jgi:hypothetical protein
MVDEVRGVTTPYGAKTDISCPERLLRNSEQETSNYYTDVWDRHMI